MTVQITNHQTGLRAEKMAAWFLRVKGYRILARRYKTPVGEIDLIAARGKTMVFIEVKSRTTMTRALESVRPQQAARIIRAAEYYMAVQRQQNIALRFDVIAVHPPFRLRHLQNVIQGK